jgi:hypothetical protein
VGAIYFITCVGAIILLPCGSYYSPLNYVGAVSCYCVGAINFITCVHGGGEILDKIPHPSKRQSFTRGVQKWSQKCFRPSLELVIGKQSSGGGCRPQNRFFDKVLLGFLLNII